MPYGRIVLSTESEELATPIVERWGIRFVRRDPWLCDNHCPFADVFRGVLQDCDRIGATDPDSEILWAQCIDPLFDQYRELIDHWDRHKRPSSGAPLEYDSARVIYPHRGYRLDQNKQPVGFGFGPWHLPSQRLPREYLVSFTASILTRQCIDSIGYYWGRDVLDFEARGRTIDIDTEEDFAIAADVYAAQMKRQGAA